ncbi:hypothetical protein HD599_002268 [Conyzicola lurida]|uniref:Uncharacterized protein n=1 Tax=Conyzicola lurida TaxID=1172621 RepID=A0A841AQU2_9MICO|nr:hypothetical protein [Conyzicola lurida]MBB5843945.1 hypothetical protein [Conyzicola lurida]
MTSHAISDAAWGEVTPEPLVWSSGPWSLELRADEIADVRFDGTVVLRSVRAVVRDRDWGTAPAAVTGVDASASELVVRLKHVGLGADFDGELRVAAASRSSFTTLDVAFSTTANADFWRNRIGLVVLHPPAVAGTPLVVEHSDGTADETRFPLSVSPHQPAFDIAALHWMGDGVESSLVFRGDVFEMEDQRNWTDASFKTYSTPLALPFPVLVPSGTVVEQSISLRGARVAAAPVSPVAEPVTLVETGLTVPEFAVGASTAPGSVPDGLALPATLLVEVDASASNASAVLDRARAEADGRPLDVRVIAASSDELDRVLDLLAGVPVRRLGVYTPGIHMSEPSLWNALVAGARTRGLAADLVGGTRAHFAELNRRHGALPDLPALTVSITPQMHATETAQLVESIAMQAVVARDALRIADGLPVHVGPVTLRARFNAVATTPAAPDTRTDIEAGYGAEFVPFATDDRQSSSALVAWTVASAAALCAEGVASIAYFESWGHRGVHGFPVATAIGWLDGLSGAALLAASAPLPSGVWMLAGRTADGTVALVANLNPAAVVVTVDGVTVEIAPLSARRLAL